MELKGVWIPRTLWTDRRLDWTEKAILMEVDLLDGECGCTATNEELADLVGCSASKVAKALSSLTRLGYLYKVGGQSRVLRSSLSHPMGLQHPVGQPVEQDAGKRKGTTRAAAFVPPTPDEVTEYARSVGYLLDGASFVDFYESKGWMVGKSRMRDWKAAVRTWRSRESGAGNSVVSSRASKYAGI